MHAVCGCTSCCCSPGIMKLSSHDASKLLWQVCVGDPYHQSVRRQCCCLLLDDGAVQLHDNFKSLHIIAAGRCWDGGRDSDWEGV